jgi:tol-pal system protein YbgF
VEQRLAKLEQAQPAASPEAGASAPRRGGRQRGRKAGLRRRAGGVPQGRLGRRAAGFASFIKRYPGSALAPSALFWLGNAQYATRNYKEAIATFRALLAAAPRHAKAPEAMLSIANCQIELKDTAGARATLNALIKTYPQSEAAQAGRDRLSKLK